MEDIKLNFLHICDYASVSIGGKLNVLGIFENIFSSSNDFTHPQLCIVTNIHIARNGTFKQTIKIVKASDNSEITKALEFNITQNAINKTKPPAVGFIGQFNSIKFSAFGEYIVQVFLDDKKVGEKSFNVTQLPT